MAWRTPVSANGTVGRRKESRYIFQTGLSLRQTFSTAHPFFAPLIHIISGQLCKGLLPPPLHNARYLRQLPKHFSRVKGHLRASQPYGNIRQYFPQIRHQVSDVFYIPDITGKAITSGSLLNIS